MELQENSNGYGTDSTLENATASVGSGGSGDYKKFRLDGWSIPSQFARASSNSARNQSDDGNNVESEQLVVDCAGEVSVTQGESSPLYKVPIGEQNDLQPAEEAAPNEPSSTGAATAHAEPKADAQQIALRNALKESYEAGICVLPPRQDGTKAPLAEWYEPLQKFTWEQWMKDISTQKDHDRWYKSGERTGIGWVCGKVSGNLEIIDFDNTGAYIAFKEAAQCSGLIEIVEKIESGYLEFTPHGVHWAYRCHEISGSIALAQRPNDRSDKKKGAKTLIETRGEGGFIVVAPTYGAVNPAGSYALQRGSISTIAEITPDEREALHDLARSLDEMPIPALEIKPRPKPNGKSTAGDRPGDIYQRKASWADVLVPAGWTEVGHRGEVTDWRRPGKTCGISATTNYHGSDCLWVFSSNGAPFECGKSYTKFGAYAILHHFGDWNAATRAVAMMYPEENTNSDVDISALLNPAQQPGDNQSSKTSDNAQHGPAEIEQAQKQKNIEAAAGLFTGPPRDLALSSAPSVAQNEAPKTPKPFGVSVDESLEFIKKYSGKKYIGLPQVTLPSIDAATAGLRGLILLAAGPNSGKTALCTQFLLDIVRNNQNAGAVIVSLEMSRVDLVLRMICSLSGISWRKLVMGPRSQFEDEKVESAVRSLRALCENRVVIMDSEQYPQVTVEDVQRGIAALRDGGVERCAVAIDYLQHWPVAADCKSEIEADKWRIGQMKQIRDYNGRDNPTIVISEIRKSKDDEFSAGGLGAIMGTARATYTPDVVMILGDRTNKHKIIEEHIRGGAERDVSEDEIETYLAQRKDNSESLVTISIPKVRDGGERIYEKKITFDYQKCKFTEGWAAAADISALMPPKREEAVSGDGTDGTATVASTGENYDMFG